MINQIARYCATFLSIFIKNNLANLQKQHQIVSNDLKKKLQSSKLGKIAKLHTHKIFSKYVYDLILKNNTMNFLRNAHIQNIFFIHNRLFIFNELRELYKDRINWKLWKKLLEENDVGDPVKYFLYPKSSGNRIRQVYHLKKYCDYSKINLFKIRYVLEIGGGYGCMADIFKKIKRDCTYIIFDTMEVNFLQYYYLKMNNIPVVMNKIETGKVCLINKLPTIKKFNDTIKKNFSSLFIANWSISEMPLKLRNSILYNVDNFDHRIISFQEKFENINNKTYFLNYQKKLQDECSIKIEKLQHYKKNLLNKSNHYYFFTKNK